MTPSAQRSPAATGDTIRVNQLVQMRAWKLFDDRASTVRLGGRLVIERPEQETGAGSSIPSCGHRYGRFVVGQRQPRLLLGHRLAGLLVREQWGHLVLLPPVGPPRQQPARCLAPQQRQQLRGHDRRRPGGGWQCRIHEDAAEKRAWQGSGDDRVKRPALLCATSTTPWLRPEAPRPAPPRRPPGARMAALPAQRVAGTARPRASQVG